MKKTIFFAIAALAVSAQAQVITLDLTQPTNPQTIEYENGNWKEVQNPDANYANLDFQVFSFLHNVDPAYYSWDGFSISKSTNTEPTDYNGGCMAKGGLQGEGTPYLVAYWSAWSALGTQIIFNDGNGYLPQEVSICQSPLAYNDIVNGGAYSNKFKQDDYFTLTITALNEEYIPDESRKVTYYLADYRGEESTWVLNNNWEKVDLTSLGKVYGLAFSMESTDTGAFGINTSTYFCLDGLAVSTIGTNVENIAEDTEAAWMIYTVAGQYLDTQHTTLRTLRQSLAQGIYIVRSGEYALKIAK